MKQGAAGGRGRDDVRNVMQRKERSAGTGRLGEYQTLGYLQGGVKGDASVEGIRETQVSSPGMDQGNPNDIKEISLSAQPLGLQPSPGLQPRMR